MNAYKEISEYNNFYMKSIVQISGLWISGSVFGVFIKPHQFRLANGFPPSFIIKEYSFEDSDEEKAMMKIVQEREDKKKQLNVTTTLDPVLLGNKEYQVRLGKDMMSDSIVAEDNSVYNKHVHAIVGQEFLDDSDTSESEDESGDESDEESDSDEESVGSDEYEEGDFIDTPVYQ